MYIWMLLTALAAPPPPSYQFRADQSLLSLRPGQIFNFKVVPKPDDISDWEVTLGNCEAMRRGALPSTHRPDKSGQLQIPIPEKSDPKMCIARVIDHTVQISPPWMEFCVGEGLATCFPRWYQRHCTDNKRTTADCLALARAHGKRSSRLPQGRLWLQFGRSPAQRTVDNASSPTWFPPLGLIYAHDREQLRVYDWTTQSIQAIEPKNKMTQMWSPFAISPRRLLVLGQDPQSAPKIGELIGCEHPDTCQVNWLRDAPARAVDIVSWDQSQQAVVIKTNFGPQSWIQVPLDPAQPMIQRPFQRIDLSSQRPPAAGAELSWFCGPQQGQRCRWPTPLTGAQPGTAFVKLSR